MKELPPSERPRSKLILRRRFLKSSLSAAGGSGLLLNSGNDLFAAKKPVPKLTKLPTLAPQPGKINKREMVLSIPPRWRAFVSLSITPTLGV